MDDQTFNSLSHTQLINGIVHARKNAEAHRMCARLMAEKEEYGLACSHLILGAEEAVKSFIILLKFEGGKMPFASVKPYFTEHPPKHAEASRIMKEILKDKGTNDFAIIAKNLVFAYLKEIPASDAVKNSVHVISSLGDFEDWWSKRANRLKNDGFYVGFKDGAWQPPANISYNQYKECETNTVRIFEFLDITKPFDFI